MTTVVTVCRIAEQQDNRQKTASQQQQKEVNGLVLTRVGHYPVSVSHVLALSPPQSLLVPPASMLVGPAAPAEYQDSQQKPRGYL